MASFPVERVRQDFPILKPKEGEKPLIYLDSGATTQKPQRVIDKMSSYYSNSNANVHRGAYPLGEEASSLYEDARFRVLQFLNGGKEQRLIFTSGATEGINLLAHSFIAPRLKERDEVLISLMEHHANILPWQLLCERYGGILRVIPVTEEGELDLTDIDELLNEKTKVLSLTHVSNVLGTLNPVKGLIEKAHAKGIPVILDGSQAVGRIPVNLQKLDVDFYVFSGHKLYGPTGIGGIVGKEKWLKEMPPYQTGGNTALQVTLNTTSWNRLPHKFEAGTPNIAGALGMAAAMDYLEGLAMEKVQSYGKELLDYALESLSRVPGFHRMGNPQKSVAIISFTLGGIHPHDIAHELGEQNICCRAGTHCAQPLLRRYGHQATTRASFSIHTTPKEIDAFIEALTLIKN